MHCAFKVGKKRIPFYNRSDENHVGPRGLSYDREAQDATNDFEKII